MKKKWWLILALIFIIGSGHYLFKTIKVKNVFDEMYYAQFQSIPGLYTSTSYSGLIKADILKSLPRNVRNHYSYLKTEYYKIEAMNEGERITLVFFQDENEGEILEYVGIMEGKREVALRYNYIYEVETQTMKIVKPDLVASEYRETENSTNDPKEIMKFLQENNLTEKDLKDYQNYFLYEKVLSDWFEHNPNSRFSMDDLGDVEIIEVEMYGD